MAMEQNPAPFNDSNQVTLKPSALPFSASIDEWERAV